MQRDDMHNNEPRLILRTCRPDGGNGYNDWRWPLTVGAVAVAPDWNPNPECGGGLHGALDGQGDGALFDWSDAAVWLVAEIDEWVDLDGKVKTPQASVVHVGDQLSATAFLAERGHTSGVIGGTATAGYDGTATAGSYGRATAGNDGTATAGHDGTATAGHRGTATAGHRGTATAGYDGTATAGNDGTATAGHRGTLILRWHDGTRTRTGVAYVGEAGIKPHTPYRLNDAGEFVEVVG